MKHSDWLEVELFDLDFLQFCWGMERERRRSRKQEKGARES